MALNGNGGYLPPAPQFPAIPNTIIYADDFNQIILDIATALSTVIFRDGQAAFTADQSMGGHKLTNLANGVNPQDATTVLQVFTDPVFVATTLQGFKISGSMFQALMATIDLVASGTLTLTGTTLLDASASGEVRLPGNTSVGTVSAAEIAYLDSVTSPIQTQLNAKANLTGGNTFTGVQVLAADLASTSVGVTQALGDSSLKLATTEFVALTAMSAALPAQTGRAGKFVQTDGTNATWERVAPAVQAQAYFFGQLG